MKKLITFFLAMTIALSLFAMGAKENAPSFEASKTREFTDSIGRTITLDANIERIAPAGELAQLVLYSIAPEKIIGWSEDLSAKSKQVFLEYNRNLPVFGTFYGKKANLNKEAVIKAAPQVVIDIGQLKGTVESMTADLDKLQSDILTPVIQIDGYINNYAKMYKTLGSILGKEEKAAELAEYASKALSYAESVREYAKDHPKRIYITNSNDGLVGFPQNSFHGELMPLLGLESVIPASKPSTVTVSLEELYKADPDVIIAMTDEGYKTITTEKAWSELSAVKNGQVFHAPDDPVSVIAGPPSTNRILGIYYLTSVIYPEFFTENLPKLASEYYNLFYHISITEDDVKNVLTL